MPWFNRKWLQKRADVPAEVEELTHLYLDDQNAFDRILEALPSNLIERYLDGLRAQGVAEAPSIDEAFEPQRMLMVIAWNAAWAPPAIYGDDVWVIAITAVGSSSADGAEAIRARFTGKAPRFGGR